MEQKISINLDKADRDTAYLSRAGRGGFGGRGGCGGFGGRGGRGSWPDNGCWLCGKPGHIKANCPENKIVAFTAYGACARMKNVAF